MTPPARPRLVSTPPRPHAVLHPKLCWRKGRQQAATYIGSGRRACLSTTMRGAEPGVQAASRARPKQQGRRRQRGGSAVAKTGCGRLASHGVSLITFLVRTP